MTKKKEKRPGTCDVCGRIQCVARKKGIICPDFYEIPDRARCHTCREPIKPGENYAAIGGKILCQTCMNARAGAQAQPQAQAQAGAGAHALVPARTQAPTTATAPAIVPPRPPASVQAPARSSGVREPATLPKREPSRRAKA